MTEENINENSTASASQVERLVIYIIIKNGVYRHDLFGVFGDLVAAKTNAIHLARTCKDDYHTYDVIALPYNKLCVVKMDNYSGNITDDDIPIFSVKKSNCELVS